MKKVITIRALEDGEKISEAATLMQDIALLGLRETLKHPVHRSIEGLNQGGKYELVD